MVKILKDIRESITSIATGMGITFRHLGKKPVAQQWPDERWVLPDRFRGFVHNDVPRCTACLACAKDCPVDCIYIETIGKGKERQMSRFAIDYNKCIWCSLCTEHCPTDCITMSHDYDHSVYKRERLVYEFVDEPVVPFKPPRPEKKTPPAAPAPAPTPAPADAGAAPAAPTAAPPAPTAAPEESGADQEGTSS